MAIVKDLIEEGWTIDAEVFYLIMSSIEIQAQTREPFRGLVNCLREQIGVDEEEYYQWTLAQGAVYPTQRRRRTNTRMFTLR